MKREVNRKICDNIIRRTVEVKKCIFHKMKKFGVGFWLFQAALQKFDHEKAHGVFKHAEENVVINVRPFEFFDALKIFQLVVIHHEVEQGRRLKKIASSRTLLRINANAIDDVGLYAEQFSKNRGDDAGLAVFYDP